MNEYLGKIDISTYTETSIDDIEKTIDEIKLADRGHVFGITTIAAGGAIVVIIIIMITCMVWQRRRIMEVIAGLKTKKHSRCWLEI